MPAERVERLGEADEVAGDQPRALVDQLIEGMLAVGAGLAPIDRARVVDRPACRRASRACRCSPSSTAADRRGSASDTARTAARRRSARRRNRCTTCRASPSARAGSARTGAVRKCSSISWKPAEHGAEIVRADRDHGREPDRRIHRIAAADPVPEPEHVGGVDAEFGNLLGIGRHRDEMLRAPPLHRRRSPSSSQSRAVWALVIVSSVVKVFDETMNNVSAGSRSCVASAKSVPSTLDTKRNVDVALAVIAAAPRRP